MICLMNNTRRLLNFCGVYTATVSQILSHAALTNGEPEDIRSRRPSQLRGTLCKHSRRDIYNREQIVCPFRIPYGVFRISMRCIPNDDVFVSRSLYWITVACGVRFRKRLRLRRTSTRRVRFDCSDGEIYRKISRSQSVDKRDNDMMSEEIFVASTQTYDVCPPRSARTLANGQNRNQRRRRREYH